MAPTYPTPPTFFSQLVSCVGTSRYVSQACGRDAASTRGMVLSEADHVEQRHVSAENSISDASQNDIIDIDHDVYGAITFSVIFDFFEILTGKDHDSLSISTNIYRLVGCTLVVCLNYALQIGLLMTVWVYIFRTSKHMAQKVYRDYHHFIFSGGAKNITLWRAWNMEDALCELAYSDFAYLYVVICVWWLAMLTELRTIHRAFRKLRHMPSTDDPNMMLRKAKLGDDVPHYVIALTPITRVALYFFLIGSKLFIAIVLAVVGSLWLLCSVGYEDVILNSLALKFILRIDEVLYQGLLPETITKEVGKMKLIVPKSMKAESHFEREARQEHDEWRGFFRSMMYMIVLFGGIWAFMTWGQVMPHLGIFPGWRSDVECPTWWERHRENLCTLGVDCFPTP